MTNLIFFVHGTSTRDVSWSMEQIRAGVHRSLGWGPQSVVAVEWGRAVGPQPLKIEPALPRSGTRSVDEEPSDRASEAAQWALLMADPSLELRVLAEIEGRPVGNVGLGSALGQPPAAVTVDARLERLEVDESVLSAAHLRPEVVRSATRRVRADPATRAAAERLGDPDDSDLILAIARTVVARVLLDLESAEGPHGPARLDDVRRDELVDAVRVRLSPTRGLARGLVRNVIAPLATRMAVRNRAALMNPFSDFIRDVAFYVQHGDRIRTYIAQQISAHRGDGLRIVLGHSLGGIAAVDLLADPSVVAGANGLGVDQLVTVGSQAPYLYLLDALHSLSPRLPDRAPFAPWLNVYNEQDLLSFLAAPVFPNQIGIEDAPVDVGVPFPESHSAYWGEPKLYELLAKALDR